MGERTIFTNYDKKRAAKTVAFAVGAFLAVLFLLVLLIDDSDSEKKQLASNQSNNTSIEKNTDPKPAVAQGMAAAEQSTSTGTPEVDTAEIAEDEDHFDHTTDSVVESENSNEVYPSLDVMQANEAERIEMTFEKYTIQEGDSLTKISKELYGSAHYWTVIANKNRGKIKDPDKILVGQTILVPTYTQQKPLWDKKYIVESSVTVYRSYKELEKVQGVTKLIERSVKRLNSPELLQQYQEEIKAIEAQYAPVESSYLSPKGSYLYNNRTFSQLS